MCRGAGPADAGPVALRPRLDPQPSCGATTSLVAIRAKIDQAWWEHLAPTPMHKLRSEVESRLNKWCETAYGRVWLESALRAGGVLRLKLGQPIPVFHIVFMRGGPTFVAPQELIRKGHRMVSTVDDYQLGPLANHELALSPIIRVDFVTDPALVQAARNFNIDLPTSAVTEPSVLFSAPAHLLLRPTGWPKKSYVLYQHIFGEGGSYPNDGYFYVGITTRSWKTRWSEHRRAMLNGSPLLFHRKLRDELAAKRVSYIHHRVMGVTTVATALYDAEEALIHGHWDDQRRLNMIPGGRAGFRYLKQHGFLSSSFAPSPDDRDGVVSAWLRQDPRRGLPAPGVSETWKRDDLTIAPICGREGRLSVKQVREIRELAGTLAVHAIVVTVGARNVRQVRRVLSGRTYSRVH